MQRTNFVKLLCIFTPTNQPSLPPLFFDIGGVSLCDISIGGDSSAKDILKKKNTRKTLVSLKEKYKKLLDTLRQNLEQLIIECKQKGVLSVKDSALTADIIFVLVDGAYYYLCLVSDKEEYQRKLIQYKKQAIAQLNFVSAAQLTR